MLICVLLIRLTGVCGLPLRWSASTFSHPNSASCMSTLSALDGTRTCPTSNTEWVSNECASYWQSIIILNIIHLYLLKFLHLHRIELLLNSYSCFWTYFSDFMSVHIMCFYLRRFLLILFLSSQSDKLICYCGTKVKWKSFSFGFCHVPQDDKHKAAVTSDSSDVDLQEDELAPSKPVEEKSSELQCQSC